MLHGCVPDTSASAFFKTSLRAKNASSRGESEGGCCGAVVGVAISPHKLTRVDSQAVRFHEKPRTQSRLFVAGLGFKRSLTQLQGNNLQSDVALPQ